MTAQENFRVGPFELDGARFYDPATHLWFQRLDDRRVRCGFDPLGAETCGDIVAVSLEPLGAAVEKGQAFGHVEAAKFVGPLVAPLDGVIAGHNPDPLADPALLNTAPMDHWLVEIESPDLASALSSLITGREALEPWFAAEVEKFERQGMIAE